MPSILSGNPSFFQRMERITPFNPIVLMSMFLGALLGITFFGGAWIPVLVVTLIPFLVYAIVKNSMLVFLIWVGSTPILSNFITVNLGAGIPDITVNRIAASILFFVLIIQVATGVKKFKNVDTAEWLMLVIVLLMIPGIMNGHRPIQAAQQIFDSIITPFIVYTLARNLISSRDQVRPLLWTIGIVTLYSASFGFYEHFTEHSLFTTTGQLNWREEGIADRIQGPFPSPSALGTVMVGGVVFFIYMFINNNKFWVRVFATVVLIIHSTTIFWSYRRSVWMGFATTIFILAFIEKRVRKIVLWVALFSIAFLAMNWAQIEQSEVYQVRFANVRTVNDRWVIWLTSWEIIKSFPLFGCGFGNFGILYDKYFTFFGNTVTTSYAHNIASTHNSYIRWWVEGGPMVTLAYLSLMGVFIRRLLLYITGRLRHAFVGKTEVMVFLGLFTTQYVQALTTDMVFYTKYPGILVFLLAGVLSHWEEKPRPKPIKPVTTGQASPGKA